MAIDSNSDLGQKLISYLQFVKSDANAFANCYQRLTAEQQQSLNQTQKASLSNRYGRLTNSIRRESCKIFIRRLSLCEAKSLLLKRYNPVVGSIRLIADNINTTTVTHWECCKPDDISLGESGSKRSNKSIESKISITVIVSNSLMQSRERLFLGLR
ncbi:unnamed protein product, partial [Medioppia subpectinata]